MNYYKSTIYYHLQQKLKKQKTTFNHANDDDLLSALRLQ